MHDVKISSLIYTFGHKMIRDEMTPNKRFGGTLNCHVPARVKSSVLQIAEREDRTLSEVVRTLLKESLKARGLIS